jgi:hypothetical protein
MKLPRITSAGQVAESLARARRRHKLQFCGKSGAVTNCGFAGIFVFTGSSIVSLSSAAASLQTTIGRSTIIFAFLHQQPG